MAANRFLVIIFLSRFVILHSSPDPPLPVPDGCPPFSCGKLGDIRFPFSNTRHRECGLLEVNCEDNKINLGNESQWYGDVGFPYPRTIEFHDPVLQSYLDDNDCHMFNHPTILPPLSTQPLVLNRSISLAMSHNFITFFKCTSETDCFESNYSRYTGCGDNPYVYYSYPNEHVLATDSLPPGCSVIRLPVNPPNPFQDANNPFQLVIARVFVHWDLTTECFECLHKGGKCHTNEEYEFRCAKAKVEGRRKTTKILASVIPGGFIIISVLIFIIWRRNKWNYLPYFLSKNTSSDLSSARDIEGGSVYFGVSVFSYSELEEATNNFDPSKELGDGGFGTVYYGKLRDGREVAVKRLYENTYKRVEQFLNEIEILTRMRHRNLVLLYGCTSRRSSELLLVYEYIPNGTVADHLHGDRARPGSLPWPIRMNIAIETASALVYLHANDIIHRDVKTNNILLDNNFCVKVADFGLSRLFPIGVTHVSTAPQGTPGYVDPEYHQCYQLTDKSDVYSFGVVLIELISSMPAVDISRHRHEINLANLAINRIQNSAFSELIDPCLGYDSDAEVERMTTSVAELAFRCLQLEKELRPTMDEVLEVLKEIQDYDNVSGDLKNGRPPLPPSPESDVAVLLNDTSKAPSSPNSVTDKWVSSRSTTASSS